MVNVAETGSEPPENNEDLDKGGADHRFIPAIDEGSGRCLAFFVFFVEAVIHIRHGRPPRWVLTCSRFGAKDHIQSPGEGRSRKKKSSKVTRRPGAK